MSRKPIDAEDIAVLLRLQAALPDVGLNGWFEGVRVLARVIEHLTAAQQHGQAVEWDMPCGECSCGIYDARAFAAFDGTFPKCKRFDRYCVGAIHCAQALTQQPAAPSGEAVALPKLKRTHPSYSREEVQWVFGYNAALDDVMRLNKNTALAQQPAPSAPARPKVGLVRAGDGTYYAFEKGQSEQPAAEEQLTYKGVPIGPMQTFADMERQASAPVGALGQQSGAVAPTTAECPHDWGQDEAHDDWARCYKCGISRRKPLDQQSAAVEVVATNSAVAAIQFALKDPEGMTFLRLWNEGEFDTLRREWPDAPVEVYINADPLAAQPGGSDNDR